jgi:hypothetical protein
MVMKLISAQSADQLSTRDLVRVTITILGTINSDSNPLDCTRNRVQLYLFSGHGSYFLVSRPFLSRTSPVIYECRLSFAQQKKIAYQVKIIHNVLSKHKNISREQTVL